MNIFCLLSLYEYQQTENFMLISNLMKLQKMSPKSVIGQNFDNQFKKSVKTPYYLHVFARKKLY
jgi:hypothetical protein